MYMCVLFYMPFLHFFINHIYLFWAIHKMRLNKLIGEIPTVVPGIVERMK